MTEELDDGPLDLSAWEAPPPPTDLADAVIARMRDTTTVGAAVAVEHVSPRTRWWRIAAAISVACAASVAATLAIAPSAGGSEPAPRVRKDEDEDEDSVARRIAQLDADLDRLQRELDDAIAALGSAKSPSAAGVGRVVGAQGLSSDEINRVLRGNAGVFRACYQRALAAKPELAGKVVVQFEIDDAGHVSNAHTLSTTLHAADVEACLATAVGKLAFPAKGGTTVVNYPFVFATDAPVAKTTPPPACDAAALAAEGKAMLASGMYASAIAVFEKAQRCRPDASLLPLLYMAACKAGNIAKVAAYWPKLPETQQLIASQSCVGNHIDPTGHGKISDWDFSAPRPDVGYLSIGSKPPAKIQIDGADTGKTTPVSKLQLTPGKHKITLVVDADRYTYAVTIKPGETTTVVKDLVP